MMSKDIVGIKAESLSLYYKIRNIQTYILVNCDVQVDADGYPLSSSEPLRRKLGPTKSDEYNALEKLAHNINEGVRGLDYLNI